MESTDIFLPDCFGFGWTLPAIASHCGLIGFSSQKLQWRNKPFYGNDKYPFTVGLWQGIDGSTIMMTHGYDYNQRFEDGYAFDALVLDDDPLKNMRAFSAAERLERYAYLGKGKLTAKFAAGEKLL